MGIRRATIASPAIAPAGNLMEYAFVALLVGDATLEAGTEVWDRDALLVSSGGGPGESVEVSATLSVLEKERVFCVREEGADID